MKLCICDLDGVIANVDARFQRAELAKEQWLMERQQGLPYAVDQRTEKSAQDVYWRAVFNPEYVPLDTLIEGVNAVLLDLQYTDGYKLVLLTSRPESMRAATVAWVHEHLDPAIDYKLFMKPSAFQYTKTYTWKAGMVQTLAAFYEADELCVVDDELVNLQEVGKFSTFARLFKQLYEVRNRLDETTPRDDALGDLADHPF
jgi:hypothetical protein